MVKSCCAYGCANRFKKGENIQFHNFPLKNPNLNKIWIQKLGRKNFSPNTYTYICGNHFRDCDYLDRPGPTIRKLKPDAYPSVFSEFPEYYQPPTKKCRTSVLDKLNKLDRNTSAESVVHPDPSLELIPEVDVLPNKDPSAIESCMQDRKRIRIHERRIKEKMQRQQKTISNLQDLVKDLKSKGLVQNHTEEVLMSQCGGVVGVTFDNELANRFRNPTGRLYSQDMKKFALTLHYHSPQAYKYCRKIFNLPRPSSLTNWLSCVNAEPGFFREVFDAMRTFSSCDTDCALIVDGMAIQKQLTWDIKTEKYVGVCDYGEEMNLEAKDTEATDALVMMVVGLRNRWKWPID